MNGSLSLTSIYIVLYQRSDDCLNRGGVCGHQQDDMLRNFSVCDERLLSWHDRGCRDEHLKHDHYVSRVRREHHEHYGHHDERE